MNCAIRVAGVFAVLALSGTSLAAQDRITFTQGCRTPRLRSLRPLSSTRTSGTVQPDQLRRRPATRTSDCGGDTGPRDATVETRARSRPVRGRATFERRADCPDSAVGRARHVAGRSGRHAAAASVGRWMATRYTRSRRHDAPAVRAPLSDPRRVSHVCDPDSSGGCVRT